MKIKKLVLIRHGESEWNKSNKFTGWHDVKLTDKGINEARKAALFLKQEKFFFDSVHTSMLKRAIYTLRYILDELDQIWLSVNKSWRLNERHYGALEGLNKDDILLRYGKEKVMSWRRSFHTIPPIITTTDKRFPGNDVRYSNIDKNDIPLGESLELTGKRVIHYWKKKIYPELKNNKRILIVAHGNSLRALMQYLYQINHQDILQLNIPTAVPIILEFNNNCIPHKWYYLK